MSNKAMDRLRDSNPVPGDVPVPSIDMLLARLDNAPAVPMRVRRRRRALSVGLAVCLLVAALVVGFVVRGRPGDRGFDVAAAVYRATAPGAGVLHVVTANTQTYLDRDARPTRSRVERWSDTSRGQLRSVQTSGGRVLEQVLDGNRSQTWTSTNPHVIRQTTVRVVDAGHPDDMVAQLRAMYRAGHVRVIGRTRFGARPVWRLRMDLPRRPGGPRIPSPIVLVDANTFVPLQMTSYGGGQFKRNGPFVRTVRGVTRYVTYERLPATARNRELLRMSHHPGAKVVHGSRRTH
jgi:hypothetical protein